MSIFPKKKNKAYPPRVLLKNAESRSGFAEAFRTLRTSIHFLLMEKDVRSLVITSAGESEGKTVTVTNLGYSFSQAGKSVVIIDGDLRKNTLTGIHNASNAKGLTGLLSELLVASPQSGSLEEYSVQDLVSIQELQRATGVLNVRDGENEVEVHFQNGDISFVDWVDRPEETRLGAVLVRNGLLSAENMERALRQQRDSGRPLGFVLAHLGLLKPEGIQGTLTLHTLEAIQTLLRMEAGSFFFSEKSDRRTAEAPAGFVDVPKLFRESTPKGSGCRFLEKIVEATLVRRDDTGYALIPSGPLPPNPSELISSRQMAFLLSFLVERFDLVIFDTPPVMVASDAVLLAAQTDGVALVVKNGHLKRGIIRKAVEQLQAAHARLLGVILNRVDVRRGAYYQYYNRYYSNYHAEPAGDRG